MVTVAGMSLAEKLKFPRKGCPVWSPRCHIPQYDAPQRHSFISHGSLIKEVLSRCPALGTP